MRVLQAGSIAFLFLLFVTVPASGGEQGDGTMKNGGTTRIRLTFDGREAVVTVYDHPATRALLSQLPLTLPFQDFAGEEKIGYLPSRLTTDGTSPQNSGDFAYYAPWGNLAIFYSGSGLADPSLIILGTIESGKSDLAAMRSEFTMTLEQIH